MKKASEIFEGKNSSLRKTFEEATNPNEISNKLVAETFDGFALEGKITEQHAKEIRNMLTWALDNEYARGYNDGAYEALKYCPTCIQMTNHNEDTCLKCGNSHSNVIEAQETLEKDIPPEWSDSLKEDPHYSS